MNDQPFRYSPVCTWIGQGEGCARSSIENYSYCDQHWALVYKAGSSLRTRHRDIRRANSVWDIESEFNQAVEELQAEGFLV
jgi:hypothetical protein